MASINRYKGLRRRLHEYRGSRPFLDLRDRVIVLVDDGLATGSTMRAAINAIRQERPRAIVVAVPVAALQTCRELQEKVDEIVCLRTPEELSAVGRWYEDSSQITDDEVRRLLTDDTTRRDRRDAYAGRGR